MTALSIVCHLPRHILNRLLAAVLAALVVAAPTPVRAARDPEVKRIKKALVALQELHDHQVAALDRLGRRWDHLDAADGKGRGDFSALVMSALGVVEQAQIETTFVHVRAALAGIEKERARTIAQLESIVAERQRAKLKKLGLAAAPAITINGSLVTYSADWEKTALCESSRRWHIDSRYDGGLQFDPITWIEFGGAEFARYAHEASKLQQIAVAERVLVIQGPRAWPNCFAPLPFDGEG